ncbi:TSUP family transporter [Acetobacter thailandicus]|uniref:TSUP family transporter n=1 Tax=Acetobacter thailandicus TaxID=1502842 RepID=UPI001BA7BB49|nr:TSUP family transporter [Acetobacter thailandicus]MBS0961424.1 TSUP family transporter [Acetobacter thailandicus]
MLKHILFAFILLLLVLFLKNFLKTIQEKERKISFSLVGVGFIFGFFDTLGVGGFAPTLAYLKNFEKIKISEIPDILLLSFAVPTVLQTFIFVSSIKISSRLLVLGIIFPLLGYAIFNHLKKYIHEKHIKNIVGFGLILSGAIAIIQNIGLISLSVNSEYIAINKEIIIYISIFFFGALTNFGVGNFSPTLILFELLGIDPRLGFPIMMGACAVIMLISGLKTKNNHTIKMSIPLSITAGMIIAVPLGAYFIHVMDIKFISWMVIAIVISSGIQAILSKN